MSYMRARARRMKKRPQGHRGFAPMGDVTYGQLPDYCFPLSENYFQLPGVPGTNGVPDYATALSTCAPIMTQAPSDPLSSLFGGNTQTAANAACNAQAIADAQKFSGSASDISANWNPAGDNFAPDDLWKIVSQMLLLSSQAATSLIGQLVPVGLTDADKGVIKIFTDALGDINTQSLNYKNAYLAAKSSGAKAVSAPGLKDWITSSLNTFSQAVFQGSLIACNEPWWAGALQTVFGVASTLVSIVKSVGSIVLAVGEKAVAAVEGGLDMIAVIEKIAPWAAIGLAAWWLFLREKKRGEKVFAL